MFCFPRAPKSPPSPPLERFQNRGPSSVTCDPGRVVRKNGEKSVGGSGAEMETQRHSARDGGVCRYGRSVTCSVARTVPISRRNKQKPPVPDRAERRVRDTWNAKTCCGDGYAVRASFVLRRGGANLRAIRIALTRGRERIRRNARGEKKRLVILPRLRRRRRRLAGSGKYRRNRRDSRLVDKGEFVVRWFGLKTQRSVWKSHVREDAVPTYFQKSFRTTFHRFTANSSANYRIGPKKTRLYSIIFKYRCLKFTTNFVSQCCWWYRRVVWKQKTRVIGYYEKKLLRKINIIFHKNELMWWNFALWWKKTICILYN